MRRFGPRLILLTALMPALLLASCSSPPPDVTDTAGDPVASSTPTSGRPSQASGKTPDPTGLMPCPPEEASDSPEALDCLGPGPAVDVFELPGVSIVPIWASWCAPCREELPIFSQAADAGLPVVGIAAADNTSAAIALAEELKLTFPSLQDPDSLSRSTLGWSALPATFVLREGEVVDRIIGRVTSVEEIRQALDRNR